VVEETTAKADLNEGKMLFAATQCLSCHSMKGEGGSAGPDLTQLGTRFSKKDILEAIIEPSKTISDQYAGTTFFLKDGSSVAGRLKNEEKGKYYVSQNPFDPQQVRVILKTDVLRTAISPVSIMYPGLINGLNPSELRNLMAYLTSAGNTGSVTSK
jgi:putative heme-binding domain-containing protein